MKKMKKTVIFLVISLAIIGCDNQSQSFTNYKYIIDIPEPNIKKFDLSLNINDYFYLPLETNSFPLREITDLEIQNNMIFVTDRFIVNCYNLEGRILYSINRLGRGPGDYNTICDIASDNNFLFIYDNNGYKVLSYEIQTGKYREQIKLKGSYVEMKAQNEMLIFYTINGLNSLLTDYEITIYNTKKKKFTNFLKHSNKEYIEGYEDQLTNNNGEIVYAAPLRNTIYKFNNKLGFIDYALVDFLKTGKKMDLKELSADLTSRTKLMESNYSYGITQWRETDNYIQFHYYRKGIPHQILYCKINKRSYSLDKYISNLPLFLFGFPTAVYNNYFIRPVDSYIFGKQTYKNLNLKDSLTKKIYSQIKNITINDNPCLLFYKFKDEIH